MNIVVCVKYVPDATADRHFEDDFTVDRVGVDGLLSELDEYAIEQSLQIKEKSASDENGGADGDGTVVTALCVGPEKATDATGSVIPAMLAERLDLPQVTLGSVIESQGKDFRIKRDGDTSTEVIGATAPLVLSVTDQSGEARYPSFKGIMAAKKKPVQTLSLADLGVSADEVGTAGATSAVVEFAKRPARSAGTKITDEGTGGEQLVAYLAAEKFV